MEVDNLARLLDVLVTGLPIPSSTFGPSLFLEAEGDDADGKAAAARAFASSSCSCNARASSDCRTKRLVSKMDSKSSSVNGSVGRFFSLTDDGNDDEGNGDVLGGTDDDCSKVGRKEGDDDDDEGMDNVLLKDARRGDDADLGNTFFGRDGVAACLL